MIEQEARGNPTRGRRRGTFWQDTFAAWYALRAWALPAEGIEAVWPEAGGSEPVDDILIRTPTRVEYHQLKHSASSADRLTSTDLFTVDRDSGRSLIADLYVGWSKATKRADGRRVEVHLDTNRELSDSPRNKLIAPADFVSEVLEPIQELGDAFDPPPDLASTWEELRTRAGAPEEEFRKFLSSLRVNAGCWDDQDLRGAIKQLLRSHLLRPRTTLDRDADALIGRVTDLATRPEDDQWLDASRLEAEFSDLFPLPVPLLRHNLALPEYFVPRPRVIEDLVDLVDSCPSGYCLVEGPPGCGKTTLATALARAAPDRVVARYHAFDPTRAIDHDRRARIRADAFTLGLLEALRLQFPTTFDVVRPAEENAGEAAETLWRGLEALGQSRRSVIIVDGIDHAARVGADASTLLQALPPPSQVPDGVLFLLFGQPNWPYPEFLSPCPRFRVPPWEADEIGALMTRMRPDRDTDRWWPVVDRVLDRTRGNPLSAVYALRTIQFIDDPDDASAILAAPSAPTDDVWAYYGLLLQDIAEAISAKDGHLALLQSRIRAYFAVAQIPITGQALAAAFPSGVRDDMAGSGLLERLSPVLERTGDGWVIFHDDFRRHLEQNLSADILRDMHRAHASWLLASERAGRIRALAEHLWLGRDDAALAALLAGRDLSSWLLDEAPSDVTAAARFALAGALRCGDVPGAIEAALFWSRSSQVSEPEYEQDQLPGLEPLRSLGDWTFVPAPRKSSSNDPMALARRARALRRIAADWGHNPALARQLYDRFALPEPELPDEIDRFDQNWRECITALGEAMLSAGEADRVLALARDRADLRSPLAEGVLSRVAAELRPTVIRAWLAELRGFTAVLARPLLDIAIDGLNAGDDSRAEAILLGLAPWLDRTPPSTRRTALVAMKRGGWAVPLSEDGVVDAEITESGNRDLPMWDVYAAGFAAGALGAAVDPEATSLPDRYESDLRARLRTDDHIPVARMSWSCGVVEGLLCRNSGLVDKALPGAMVGQLLKHSPPGQSAHLNFEWNKAVEFLLPSLTRAAERSDDHWPPVRRMLRRHAVLALDATNERTLQVFGLLGGLDPAGARWLLRRAVQVSGLPGSDGESRRAWFDLWSAIAEGLSYELPEDFKRRGRASKLGIIRKGPDPADRVIQVLLGARFRQADAPVLLSELARLLPRLHEEWEGDRYTHDAAMELLAISLRESPGLFESLFLELTGPRGFLHPYGPAPGQIIDRWVEIGGLRSRGLDADGVTSIWYWLATAGGSLRRGEGARALLLRLAESVSQLGAPSRADQLREWTDAFTTAEDPRERSTHPPEPEGELLPLTPGELKQIPLGWTSWFFGSKDYHRLRRYIAEGGASAFKTVLGGLAESVADGGQSTWAGDHIADFLIAQLPDSGSMRRQVAEITLLHLEELVSFQPAASASAASFASPAPGRRVQDVFVRFVALALETSDAETVRRGIRSLALLGQVPALRGDVTEAALNLLPAQLGDERRACFALSVIRSVGLDEERAAQIEPLLEHPNAEIRVLAADCLQRSPSWAPSTSGVVGPGGLRADGLGADLKRGDTSFRWTPYAIREKYIAWLSELTNGNEDDIRALIRRIEDAGCLIERAPPQFGGRFGNIQLAPHNMDAIIGRAVTRLCGELEAPFRSVALSALMSADPNLMTCPPIVQAPAEWVELAAISRDPDQGGRVEVRGVAVAPEQAARASSRDLPTVLARESASALAPLAPSEYPWVSSLPIERHAIPNLDAARFDPLFFKATHFTALQRAAAELVPRWWCPAFEDLEYLPSPWPSFRTQEGSEALRLSLRERNVDPPRTRPYDHPAIAFELSWHAEPRWLADMLSRLGYRAGRFRWSWDSADPDEASEHRNESTYSWEILPE